jgi:hypothetical protein
MKTLAHSIAALSIATTALLAIACRGTSIETTWPHLLVSGTVLTNAGMPAKGTQVRVTTWASPSTCGDSVAISSVFAPTAAAGTYSAPVYTTIPPFTGCVRVEAATVHADTSLAAVPDGTHLVIDLRLQ